jgi:glycosyltransferase involved in cell wall biosynthesis
MTPFFSVIISTYNRSEMLMIAVDSVLEQTFMDWELIIVDDGSTDNTRAAVIARNDTRIKYIYQQNSERSAARNNGIANANGKYICFLDSDDYYLPQRLELLHQAIIKAGDAVAMFYTGIIFEKKGNMARRVELTNDFSNKFDFIALATIGVPQTCISREILLKQKFNEAFHIGEDLELWLRIISEFPVSYMEDNYSVIAVDHDDRSVSLKKFNPGKEELRMLRYIFAGDHPGSMISRGIRKQKISNAHFSVARHYIMNGKKHKAIACLMRSVWACPGHRQTKHKLYMIMRMVFGREIKEYSNV